MQHYFVFCPTVIVYCNTIWLLSSSLFLFLGKNKASICQKLDEIIAKQKSLEIKDKTNNPSLNFKKEVPVHSQRTVNKKQKKLGTGGKAEHVINSKQKNLELEDGRTEILSTNQKKTSAKPPIPHQTPQLRKCPPAVPSRERTRPNILSHSKPQALAEDQGWYTQHQTLSSLIRLVRVFLNMTVFYSLASHYSPNHNIK